MSSSSSGKKWPLYLGVAFLVLLGSWSIYKKATVYGYSLTQRAQEPVWLVEAAISFRADGEPVKVSLAVPKDSSAFHILDEKSIAPGYSVSLQEQDSGRRAIWSKRSAEGPQKIFYRLDVFDAVGGQVLLQQDPPPTPNKPRFEEPYNTTALDLVASIHERSADDDSFASELIRQISQYKRNEALQTLLELDPDLVSLTRKLLALEGIPSRLTRGVSLEKDSRLEPMRQLIDIYTGDAWELFDPTTGKKGIPSRFLLWQRGESSLLDVEGGRGSKVSVSVIQKARPTNELILKRKDLTESALWDLSVYTLPIKEQNVFKKLFVIPLGALIVVIVRNLIGFKTSGTFMPILLALAFLETKLLPGLIILFVMIAAGLGIRSYLSKLNLLLVPRISVGIIVVIFIMAAMSIISFKMGLETGMRVTFFPMIIIAWTIERMSIAAEEQGIREVLIQLGGSLFVAVIVYLTMSNKHITHFMYAFPEANLIILGIILLLGVYTGYRLTELHRFQPLVENTKKGE
ncbi:inactive transglutaminase family protein [Pelagicoccus mobilis]|uniref:Inactive transglutaminase family protein n=1 Tax=Pelagicoccus mobilis TaxID=415221 RepID=A0A934S1N5_9BACT|nr:inactive transglutaminase family protein [Pelagicoccus mobilis]MBK1878971.1 inactive transglutaminase family protein [Pelagicoccus mobilis]